MPEQTSGERARDEQERSPSARALTHPLFLASLALLLLNDHVLKGAPIAPSWLTGKLSDFSGLIVAPVLLAALFQARARGARAAAIAVPAALFSALQLWPSVAAAYDGLFHFAGLRSQTVSDLSDLIALAVLPLAWHILARSATRDSQAAYTAHTRLALGRVALGLGIFACVATSAPPNPGPRAGSFQTTAAVANFSSEAIDVRIRWAEVDLDCMTIEPSELGRLVPRTAFADGVTFNLQPNETAPIEQLAALASLRGELPMVPPPACEIALLSVDGLDETVVFWTSDGALGPARGSVPELLTGPGDVGLPLASIVDSEGRLAVELSRALAAPLVDPLPAAPMCGAWGEPIVHSELGGLDGMLVIQERSATLDGCLSLVVAREVPSPFPGEPAMLTTPARVFLCGLADLFPFDAGDRVELVRSATLVTFIGVDDDRELRLYEGVTGLRAGPIDLSLRPGGSECWRRAECGAYLRAPELVETHFTRLEPELAVGVSSGTVDETTGRTVRVLVTRAETVVAGIAGCDSARDAPQTLMDAVVAFGATPTPEPLPAGEM